MTVFSVRLSTKTCPRNRHFRRFMKVIFAGIAQR